MTVTNGRRGMALVIVLGLVAFLSLIGYTMAFSVRVHARIADNAVRQVQARYLAAAAVEHAMALLVDDEVAQESGIEAWMDPAVFEPMVLGGGTVEVSVADPAAESGLRYGLVDEASKLNLNTATREELLRLPNMTDALADCVIDWRDTDETPSAFGAESEAYLALDDPYSAKNRNLETLRELLLVIGYDNSVLYGEDANRNGVLDANEDDGMQSEPPDDADGVLDEGLLRYVTVYSAEINVQRDGSPRINIQTASAEQLRDAMEGLASDQAEAIVAYRGGNQFRSIADLMNVTAPQSDEQEGRQGGPRRGGSSGGEQGRGGNRGGRAQGGEQNQAEDESGRSQGDSSGASAGPKLFSASDLARWADAITVSDEERLPGLINLNTALPEVLAAVEGLEEEDVAQIELLRGSESTPFQSVADLMNLSSMNDEKFQRVVGRFTTRGSQFTINGVGKMSGRPARRQVEAVVERSGGDVHILYWREQ